MTISQTEPEHDTSTDIRRLIDAGYTVEFSSFPGDGDYFAEIKGEFGSTWQGLGDEPSEALRSVWPLGYGHGQSGCGHCAGEGCVTEKCAVCAAYTDEPGNGVCGVCGIGDVLDADDDLDPYCSTCRGDVAIFHGMEGWHHYRVTDGRNEIYDPGHAPAVTWRTLGARA
jgi:hypothetical protein